MSLARDDSCLLWLKPPARVDCWHISYMRRAGHLVHRTECCDLAPIGAETPACRDRRFRWHAPPRVQVQQSGHLGSVCNAHLRHYRHLFARFFDTVDAVSCRTGVTMLVIIGVRRLDDDRIEIGVAKAQHDSNPTRNYLTEKEVRAVLSGFGISEETFLRPPSNEPSWCILASGFQCRRRMKTDIDGRSRLVRALWRY